MPASHRKTAAPMLLSVITSAVLLTACGGGGEADAPGTPTEATASTTDQPDTTAADTSSWADMAAAAAGGLSAEVSAAAAPLTPSEQALDAESRLVAVADAAAAPAAQAAAADGDPSTDQSILAAAGPSDGTSPYVSVRNGHLYKNGKRLRVWGVNLQSGVFKTYAEIDLLVARLVKLGINGIRLWPTAGTFYRQDARGFAAQRRLGRTENVEPAHAATPVISGSGRRLILKVKPSLRSVSTYRRYSAGLSLAAVVKSAWLAMMQKQQDKRDMPAP